MLSAAQPSGNVAESSVEQTSLCQAVGQVLECPLDYFLNYLLPPAPGDVPARVKSELGIESGWAAKYELPDLQNPMANGDRTFQRLCTIFNDVNAIYHCKQPQDTLLEMVDTSNREPSSEKGSKPAHKVRPDSCLAIRRAKTKSVLPLEKDEVAWCDVALTCEYRKRDGYDGFRDNFEKVLWTMTQTMALDPCRQFTFGITIEDTGIRLWFCDRSAYMVSEPISYLNSTSIVDVFLRLSSASEEQLGYDLSITRVLDYRGTTQYDIQLPTPDGTRILRTKSLLANCRMDRATGRATRVWEVYESEGKDDQKTHALKDTWVEASHAREGQTYESVLEGASDDDKRYFLTVLHHGDVKLASGEGDITLSSRSGSVPSRFKVFNGLFQTYFQRPMAELQESKSRPLGILKHPRAFIDRVHYRILFDEVGIPLSKLRNLGQIWQIVCDANKGLITMAKANHIHGDVSAGNILLYKGRGKISDLEFSTVYQPGTDDNEIRAPLTGTADFMSAELFSQNYLYMPIRQRKSPLTSTWPEFLQNYLHDAESLWWIALWSLARLDPLGRDLAEDREALGRRHNLYLDWFPLENRGLGNVFDWTLRPAGPDTLNSEELPVAYRQIQSILTKWREAIGDLQYKSPQ